MFDSDGNSQLVFSVGDNTSGWFSSPYDVAIDSMRDRIYVIDATNLSVQVFDLKGNQLKTFGSHGKDIGQFDNPLGIAVDTTDNTIYVADSWNNRIQVFDLEGNFKFTFGDDDVNGQVEFPQGITINPVNDTIYVADSWNNRIQVFDLEGQYLKTLGSDVTDNEKTKEERNQEKDTINNNSINKDNKDGGGCLIATASYGTEMASEIQQLREIRDNTLLTTTSGTVFMNEFNTLYYSFAPIIADTQREYPIFKDAVRTFIAPLISTLSIMSLAEDGSELQVLGLGISLIALNFGIYIGIPAFAMVTVSKHLRSQH